MHHNPHIRQHPRPLRARHRAISLRQIDILAMADNPAREAEDIRADRLGIPDGTRDAEDEQQNAADEERGQPAPVGGVYVLREGAVGGGGE
ncbi:hypothetical protein MMC17_005179 [Xylographa soralifera]|nr:hypothetical protein [Xylographa soralifera]